MKVCEEKQEKDEDLSFVKNVLSVHDICKKGNHEVGKTPM